MARSILTRVLSTILLLSRRLRILFQRREVYLVEDQSLSTALAFAGLSQDELKSTRCASCGQELSVENIEAWVILPQGISFYCGGEECLATLTKGENYNGSQR